MDIPVEYADKYHQMDPKTEDLLSGGHALRAGMIVLREDPIDRIDTVMLMSEDIDKVTSTIDRARTHNRWCRVENVDVTWGNDASVSFVAVYADGTKRKRTAALSQAWYVKLDSLPKEEQEAETVQVTQIGSGRMATVPIAEFDGITLTESLPQGDQRAGGHGGFPPGLKVPRSFIDMARREQEAAKGMVECVQGDAKATTGMLSADTSPSDEDDEPMILAEDVFSLLEDSVRELVPGLEFKEDGAFWVLRVAVEEVPEVKDSSKMTTSEYGEAAHKQRNSEVLSRLGQDARAELERQGVRFDGESGGASDEPGPLVRAMLLEERTTTEVTRTYGPDDWFGNGRRRDPRRRF